MKRIKDNITPKQFKHLMTYLAADESIRRLRKDRLEKSFVLLYLFGLRVNELTQFTNTMLHRLFKEKKIKIIAHKQNKQRQLYLSKSGEKLLKKYFDTKNDTQELIFTSERGNSKRPLSVNSVIRDINSYLHTVFPYENITSHSFRQTLITEMSQKSINTKVIQEVIGHKNISTTYRYIKVSENDIQEALSIVR